MAVVNPVPAEKAPEELRELYEALKKRLGFVPNIYGAMAHCPSALKNFLPLLRGLTTEGTVEPKYKELAYLKAASVNGCEY